MKLNIVLGCGALLILTPAWAATRYVDLNSANPSPPYTSWSSAATNVQDAIDASAEGDLILVTNGVYEKGGRVVYGSLTNRVAVNKAVTVQSVDGPGVTVIQGKQVPGATNGDSAVRCVYLTNNAVLIGFTLASGATRDAGDITQEESGGGAWCEGTNAFLENCVMISNAAPMQCGGIYSGTASNCVIVRNIVTGSGGEGGGAGFGDLVDCLLSGNASPGSAGGAIRSSLDRCLMTNNLGGFGAAAALCTLNNCLIVGNGDTNLAASIVGGCTLNNCTVVGNAIKAGVVGSVGAAASSTLNNCIVFYNLQGASQESDCNQCTLRNCCTSSLSQNTATNCITLPPAFADVLHGDYHLRLLSPGMDGGMDSYAPAGTDLDGNPRIVGHAVDIGAYEVQKVIANSVHYVSLGNRNPVAPYADWATAATNLQDAVAAAQPGDIVAAGAGAYTNGGVAISGSESNRVALTNGVMLFGVSGPESSLLVGGAQTRCAYVGSNSVISGFTLTNGRAALSGDLTNDMSGGGAWCESGGAVTNCIVENNAVYPYYPQPFGGGIYGGTVWSSLISSNLASHGGGAADAALFNCTVVSNRANATLDCGGGVYQGVLSNCTVLRNWGYSGGGGICRSAAFNSLIASNSLGQDVGGGAYKSVLNGCVIMFNDHSATAYGSNIICEIRENGDFNHLGGGAYESTNINCLLMENISLGGAVYGGASYNCLLVGNVGSDNGSAAYNATLYNCTVAGNGTVTNRSSAVYGGALYNCIIYSNYSAVVANWTNSPLFSYCCTTPLPASGAGNFSDPPLFVGSPDDFRLQSNSPCINAGNNAYAFGTEDLDGNPRIAGGTADVGAYEFQSPASVLSYAWAQQFGLPTDGSADYLDTDGDRMNNWQEWRSGTDPTSAASVLEILSATATNNSSGITVRWQSVGGRRYYLQRGTDLGVQPAFLTIQTNIAGQDRATDYTDPSATNSGPFFYRIGLQD